MYLITIQLYKIPKFLYGRNHKNNSPNWKISFATNTKWLVSLMYKKFLQALITDRRQLSLKCKKLLSTKR